MVLLPERRGWRSVGPAGKYAMLTVLVVHTFVQCRGASCQKEIVVTSSSSHDYPANAPIEDRHTVPGGGGDSWFHAAVFDGHGGFDVSEHAKAILPSIMALELKSIDEHRANGSMVAQALDKAYERCEEQWVAKWRAMHPGQARRKAEVGACALYTVIRDSKVYTANAGDCRAVLGRRDGANGWTALALSRDHNSREAQVRQELEEAHPGEQDIVVCMNPHACYVKGRLQPARSFGDLHLKLSEFNPGHTRWTPPYVDWHPEVTVATLQPGDSFIIMGSDGLWDVFSNEEAVQLVAQRLQETEGSSDGATVAGWLVEQVLKRSAEGMGISVERLKAFPQGRDRRNRHDDITAVVLILGEKDVGDGCGATEEPSGAQLNEDDFVGADENKEAVEL